MRKEDTMPGEIYDFDQVVKVLYPFLSKTGNISQKEPAELTEIIAAGVWLSENLNKNRGPSFETLRSLSVADTKAMRKDPRDSIGVKLLGRILMGDGSSDSDVESFVKSNLSPIIDQAIWHLVERASANGSDFLNDEQNRNTVLNHIATFLLGGQPLVSFTPQELDARIGTFKSQVRQTLASPAILGNLLASQGRFDLKAMKKADKRAAKGKYKAEDIAAIKHFAQRQYRPSIEIIARFQKRVGWPVVDWDPVSEADRLGRR
jgi:hypothetical protein